MYYGIDEMTDKQVSDLANLTAQIYGLPTDYVSEKGDDGALELTYLIMEDECRNGGFEKMRLIVEALRPEASEIHITDYVNIEREIWVTGKPVRIYASILHMDTEPVIQPGLRERIMRRIGVLR